MAKEAKLDGYTLSEKMRKTRRKLPLTSTEQALFHELVALCNEDEWADVFPCSNYDLCSALQVSENSLEKARQRLVQVGLIHYRSGKSRRVYGQYSFTKKLTTSRTTSNFETDNGVDSGVDVGVDNGVDVGVEGSDINTKTKTETEIKTETKKSFAAAAAQGEKIPDVKKMVEGKNSDESTTKTKRDFWKTFTGTWDFFYEKMKGEKYQYQKKDFGCLEKIYDFLKKRSEIKKYEWTEKNMVEGFEYFLNAAYKKDEWMRQNFSIPNVLSQFNQIANEQAGHAKNKQPTGGRVSTASAFDAIDKHFGKA